MRRSRLVLSSLLIEFAALFASPQGSPKVILRVGYLAQGQEEEFFNFTGVFASYCSVRSS